MSREDWEVFDALREERKQKKERRRADWEGLVRSGHAPGEWTKCHDTHWQTVLKGETLDYWPGTLKWRWQGKTRTGNVVKFIREELKR